jgi:hypothetical protein
MSQIVILHSLLLPNRHFLTIESEWFYFLVNKAGFLKINNPYRKLKKSFTKVIFLFFHFFLF